MTVTVTHDSDLAYKDSPSRSALVFNLDLVYTPALGLCLPNSLDSNLCGLALRWPSLTLDQSSFLHRFRRGSRLSG